MQETVILVRISLIAFFILSLSYLNCSELSEYDNQRIREALGDSLISSSTTRMLSMDIIEDGILKLKLESTVAHTIKEERKKMTYFSGPVKIQIFESDTLDTEVFSDSALYSPSESIFELFGNVLVKTKTRKRLHSDYLKWLRSENEVSTPGNVIIVTPSDSINAVGFIGDTDLTNYILNEVTGETVIN